jgi:hypothetical protein
LFLFFNMFRTLQQLSDLEKMLRPLDKSRYANGTEYSAAAVNRAQNYMYGTVIVLLIVTILVFVRDGFSMKSIALALILSGTTFAAYKLPSVYGPMELDSWNRWRNASQPQPQPQPSTAAPAQPVPNALPQVTV